jgi:hypothetical protein
MASTRRDVGDAAILPEVVLLSWLRFRTGHKAGSIGRSLKGICFLATLLFSNQAPAAIRIVNKSENRRD